MPSPRIRVRQRRKMITGAHGVLRIRDWPVPGSCGAAWLVREPRCLCCGAWRCGSAAARRGLAAREYAAAAARVLARGSAWLCRVAWRARAGEALGSAPRICA